VPRRRESVTVLVPARNEAANIAPIVRDLVSLLDDGMIDQVLVAEHDSTDGTAETASRLGAEVVRTAGVYPELGPVLGKGDNLWRGLTAARGDIVCFIDGDSADFGPHFVHRLFGPLRKPGIAYVKAFYRRPWRDGDVVKPTGGGRVTTLLARPLLRRFYPELAWLQQPLAGEMAARRSLLESLPFATGTASRSGSSSTSTAESGPLRSARSTSTRGRTGTSRSRTSARCPTRSSKASPPGSWRRAASPVSRRSGATAPRSPACAPRPDGAAPARRSHVFRLVRR